MPKGTLPGKWVLSVGSDSVGSPDYTDNSMPGPADRTPLQMVEHSNDRVPKPVYQTQLQIDPIQENSADQTAKQDHEAVDQQADSIDFLW